MTLVRRGLATVEEFVERVEKQSPRSMHVGYHDTIFDLAPGGTGSVVAGAVIIFWVHLRRKQNQADWHLSRDTVSRLAARC